MSQGKRPSGRFRILQLTILALSLVLAARVVQIQIFKHEHYEARAHQQWTRDIELAAERGNMYDRQGRPLALSVTRWRVGVARSLVKDRDKLADLLAEVLEMPRRDIIRKLRSGESHVVLGRKVVLSREDKIRLSRQPAVTLDDMRSRIYPHDAVGAALIGFYTHSEENCVAVGLEHGLNDILAGTPGRARRILSAEQKDLGQVVLQRAEHGQNAVLTLDADLQAIAEERLARAVKEVRAEGGSVLITDPATGDILAAASWPVLPGRDQACRDSKVWKNRNFTDCFEPGSVFKIFSTASLLRNGAIDTATVYDCSNSDFGRFHIRNDDDHKYGDLPLMRAFSKSSNIYFARAVGNLSDDEFFRDLVDFGFGQKTTLPYPGQAEGILHKPSSWTVRSRPTIAIGQEVAVTSLQLAMALGAIANGGTLYAPRLVKETRDQDGRLVKEMRPVPLRRIISEPESALLREAMRRVVLEGTGKAAWTDWISVGGKTGTAQKAVPGQGYPAGKYVASFTGLVPMDDPRLVIVTVLDEPRGFKKYYAAESALPLFSSVVRDIRQSTAWLQDVPGGRTAPMAAEEMQAEIVVPDVLHLNADKAARRLARAGLRAQGNQHQGMVVQQVPAAGSKVTRDQVVQLTVATRPARTASATTVCPDFSGMSNRQALGLAARLGLTLELEGAGYAVSQNPAPGKPLTDNRVRVKLEATWR
jgi:stage V sporulation protein D (sporulation-specific penicillin-binding protein)